MEFLNKLLLMVLCFSIGIPKLDLSFINKTCHVPSGILFDTAEFHYMNW